MSLQSKRFQNLISSLVAVFAAFGLALAFGLESLAQGASSPVQSAEELQIQEMARQKTYLGGQDESDLKVQSPMYEPEKKLGEKKDAKSNKAEEEE